MDGNVMEKLTLTPNKPAVIALAFTEGKPVSSNFGGDQIMYTLMDGRRFYADMEAAEKIDALSLGKGEPFEFTMCVDRTKKKSYEARYLENDAPPVPLAAALAPPVVVPQAAAPRRVASTPQSDNRAAQVVSQPAQQNTAPSANSPGGMLMGCFMSAVDAVIESAAYAQRRGFAFAPTADNITSAALTLYINQTKGAR